MAQINTDNSGVEVLQETDEWDFRFEVDEVLHITMHHSVLGGRLVSGTLRLNDLTTVEFEDGSSRQAGLTWFNVIVPGKAGGIFTTDDVEAPCRVFVQALGIQNLPVKLPQTLRRKPKAK
jgi:hypothetical protein